MDTVYRCFQIYYDPPPVPIRKWDWHFAHIDYDGEGDNRIGHCPTLEAAKAEIDAWYDEQEED